MDKPKIAARQPIPIDLVEGKRYSWCTCGLSDNQPWCNGAHKGTDFAPMKFVAEETKTAYMCQCKATGNPGFCDGAHNSLPE